MIIQPTPPARRSTSAQRHPATRATWPLTVYGTGAAGLMLAGIVLVIVAVWVS